MPRFVAFLRAINVGGHTVKMDRLRELFQSLGFRNVETFIASGNVIFETNTKDTRALEKKIEAKLKGELGYDVATFVRTEAELANVARYQAYPHAVAETAGALLVGFLVDHVTDEIKGKLVALRTEVDEFHVNGREVYWMCKKKQSETMLKGGAFEKTLGGKATFRLLNTVRRIAERYSRD
ncbi:MAG: DUF1697 domain-containing protein [Acidobacteriota bacterium]